MTVKDQPQHLTLWLEQAATNAPEKPFFLGEEELTYGETWSRVGSLVNGLLKAGVKRGDRVLIVAENRIEVALLAFAVAHVGGVFVILSPQLKEEGFQRILEQCEPTCLFLEAGTAHLRGVVTGTTPVLWLDATDSKQGDGLYADWLQLLSLSLPAVSAPDDAAFLVFTSGSTGAPRGVIMTHGNVHFVSQAIQSRLNYREEDRIGLFLPLAFDYSLYQLFYAAICGASVFIGRPEMTGATLPRLLAAHRITILPVVPTVIGGLLKMQRYRPTPLPHLRMLTNTGDHLPRTYIDQWHELFPGCQVFPMYGLTECKRVSILLPSEWSSHPDSVGRPLDGTEVVTVDPDGNLLPSGEIGELVIFGPHVSPGYWRAPEETARRFRHWNGRYALFSGDQGRVDAEGFITFHGRDESLIKHRGYRLNPLEIEEAACRLPSVVAAGCVKDDVRDRLCLFLVVSEAPPEESSILAALAQVLERGKLPDRVFFLPELPRTSNQKLDRKALRQQLTTL